MLTIIPNKSISLLQCWCSCQFFVHSSLYCAVKPCVRKLKEYKNTQPLIRTSESLPETGILANQKPRNLLQSTTGNTNTVQTSTFWHVGPCMKLVHNDWGSFWWFKMFARVVDLFYSKKVNDSSGNHFIEILMFWWGRWCFDDDARDVSRHPRDPVEGHPDW